MSQTRGHLQLWLSNLKTPKRIPAEMQSYFFGPDSTSRIVARLTAFTPKRLIIETPLDLRHGSHLGPGNPSKVTSHQTQQNDEAQNQPKQVGFPKGGVEHHLKKPCRVELRRPCMRSRVLLKHTTHTHTRSVKTRDQELDGHGRTPIDVLPSKSTHVHVHVHILNDKPTGCLSWT